MSPVHVNSRGGCWDINAMVLRPDGTRTKTRDLRRGDVVWTPNGPRAVEFIKCQNTISAMWRLTSADDNQTLMITSNHPCLSASASAGEEIEFVPARTLPGKKVDLDNTTSLVVASLVLQGSDPYAVDVNGFQVATLAHGNTAIKGLAHPIYGTAVSRRYCAELEMHQNAALRNTGSHTMLVHKDYPPYQQGSGRVYACDSSLQMFLKLDAVIAAARGSAPNPVI